jgi:hypothetical protein
MRQGVAKILKVLKPWVERFKMFPTQWAMVLSRRETPCAANSLAPGHLVGAR